MRSDIISEIIRVASIISVAFPLVAYLIKIRSASKPLHLIGALSIVSAISDVLAYFFFAQGKSTVVLFNLYYAILFLLLTWFFYEILLVKTGKRTVIVGLVVYILAFILVSLYVQNFFEYQTFMW